MPTTRRTSTERKRIQSAFILTDESEKCKVVLLRVKKTSRGSLRCGSNNS